MLFTPVITTMEAPASYANAHSVLGPDVDILATERVTTLAMRLCLKLSRARGWPNSPVSVLSLSDRFQVERSNTQLHTAEMVDHKAISDGSDPQFVCKAVRQNPGRSPFLAYVMRAVAAPMFIAGEKPTFTQIRTLCRNWAVAVYQDFKATDGFQSFHVVLPGGK